jgi:uncharacterized membrane protein
MMFDDPFVLLALQLGAEWKEMDEAAKKDFNDRAAEETETKKAAAAEEEEEEEEEGENDDGEQETKKTKKGRKTKKDGTPKKPRKISGTFRDALEVCFSSGWMWADELL